MRLFGLIGYPLEHSLSKVFFTEKFERENLPHCRYENFPMQSTSALPDLIKRYPELEGLNVTIPHKKAVLYHLHDASDEVKQTGACNCIHIRNGKLYGFNTDTRGFECAVNELLEPCHKKALILGTGGAAQAVAFVLKKKGISFLFISRRTGKNSITWSQLTEKFIEEHLLIINTTPLGMFPETDTFPDLPYHAIGEKHLLFDLIYNPRETVFMKKGREQGAKVSNGEKMWRMQAEESWKIWNE